MSDIFICYSRADSTVARHVEECLRAQGWSVFLDVQTRVGKRWHKEIEKELHAARAVVVLWSATSRESDFVLEEAEYGKRKELLFPAFIEKVEYPYGFGRIQTADLIGWAGQPDHAGLLELVGSLQLHLNPGEIPPARHEPLPRPAAVQIPDPRLSPGQTFRDKLKTGGDGPLMVVIPAGRFVMGSPQDEAERSADEEPQHEVGIARPFALGVYAVTFDDYDQFCDASNHKKPEDMNWGRGTRPVINVSWDDAQTYCRWLSAQSGRSYRLPSEAEWEYACRAGSDTAFHFGAQISTDQANFDGNHPYKGCAKGEYRKRTMPVDSFAPNQFGLYNMHGNVWEWCQDHWHESYRGAPTDGSPWEDKEGGARVVRGGSWDGLAALARAAVRDYYNPGFRYDLIGFRVLCSSPIE